MGSEFKQMGTSEVHEVTLIPLKKFAKELCKPDWVVVIIFKSTHRTLFLFWETRADVHRCRCSPVQMFSGTTGMTKNIETLRNLMSQVKQTFVEGIIKNREQQAGTPWMMQPKQHMVRNLMTAQLLLRICS